MTAASPDRRHRPMRRGATALALALALAWGLVACTGSGSEGSATTTAPPVASVVETTTTEATDTTNSVNTTEPADPVDTSDCPSAADVGDIMGSTVDRSVSVSDRGSTDGPSVSAEGCRYELADDGGTVTITRLTATDGVDGPLFPALEAAAEADAARDGFERTSLGEQAAYDTGTAVVVATIDQPLEVTTEALDLDAEAAAQLRVRLAELTLYGR